MTTVPSVDDLELVDALARGGSLGAAARTLQIAQPSASQRLARLERRCGVALFVRDTQGSRPTAAGSALITQAQHILGHLDLVFERVRAAAETKTVAIGTFPSLAAAFLPAVDVALRGQLTVEPVIEHGERLLEWLAEGSLAAALIGFAHQQPMPRGSRSVPVGRDRLVVVVPKGVRFDRSGRAPFRGHEIVYSTYDLRGPGVAERLTRLGGTARRGGTGTGAVEIARLTGGLAVVPRSGVVGTLRPGERTHDLPFPTALRLSLVMAPDAPPELAPAMPAVRKHMGLT